MLTIVAIKQMYPGHAKQAALLATNVASGGYLGRYSIVVDDDIDNAMAGNICRCGTYQRIRAGIHRAAQIKKGGA